LAEEEFLELRARFMETLTGKNVFVRTTPQELEKFRSFVADTSPYDLVIDGLNIVYSRGTMRPQAKEGVQRVRN
jgi:hypothetical protein